MTRKLKPKKKHQYRKEESDDLKLKRKKKVPKEKYRNPRKWMEENLDAKEEE